MATRAGSRPLPNSRTRSGNKRSSRKNESHMVRNSFDAVRSLLAPGRIIPEPGSINRELVGGLSALVALITTWSMLARAAHGMLVAAVDSGLGWLTGRAPHDIPVLTTLLAVQCFRSRPGRALSHAQCAGGLMFGLAVPGITHAAAMGSMRERGGFVGREVYDGLYSLLGEVPSVAILMAAGIASVFLITGTTPVFLLRELARIAQIVYRPLPPFDGMEAFDSILDVPIIPDPIARRPEAGPVINAPKTVPVAPKPVSPPVLPKALVVDQNMPLPNIAKLHLYEGVSLDKSDLTIKARRIEETLASFKVDARVREINPGPAVTQYTLEPGLGTKVRRITELQNDLALALAAPSIRIEAPVPGLARVGLEIPNSKVSTVGLRETLESDRFLNGKFKLPIPLGRDVNGNYVIHDLTRMPHLLIAGATGSGKSVCLTAIISTFLASRRPTELKMLMMDPKMVELVGYNGVPHLQCPVVTEMDKVVGALRLALQEMERRYTLFSKMGVRNLDGYRMKVADEPNAEQIPYMVVIIDELADLMMTAPDD